MHFSSMAVSVLAQSVPLLAVGHLAGWKKREERSWLQSRRLRDAFLVQDDDRKCMLFKKHVGVNGKHNDVLEKKRSGSAPLVQDHASSEVSFDARKALVECDPLSKVTDSGIFDCGMDSHCVESKESKMGGLCVAVNLAPSINRALQSNVTCAEGPEELGAICDCSKFNNTIGVGNFTCTGESCMGPYCLTSSYNKTVNADGSSYAIECYDLGVELSTSLGLESFCVSFSSNLTSTECEIKADGVPCNSCEPYTCPAGSASPAAYLFDCTNNVLNVGGSACDIGVFQSFAQATNKTIAPFETSSPSASPNTMPTTAGEPTASPDEMPSPAVTSSGNNHAAKATVVATAVAAAWVASFGF